MTELMWVRSHVEQLLQRERDTCRVAVDRDGDFPFRCGTAAGWVAVLDGQPIVVRVTAHAVYGVKSSAKLLRELNEINVRALTATVQLIDDIVVVQQTILPIGLTQPVLAQAVHAVGGVADNIGGLLAAMFDGSTPHHPRCHGITLDATTTDEDGKGR
jgi:hypothetical protein